MNSSSAPTSVRGGILRLDDPNALSASSVTSLAGGTLTGNALTLDKHFRIKVEGSPAQWTLTLHPRDQRLATQVRELKITGMAGELRVVELWLAGGDRSVMAIEPLQAVAP